MLAEGKPSLMCLFIASLCCDDASITQIVFYSQDTMIYVFFFVQTYCLNDISRRLKRNIICLLNIRDK